MSTMGNMTANGPSGSESSQGASSTTEQAKDKVQEAAGQARGQVRQQLDQRSTQAGERVSSTAEDVRSVAQQLREQGKDQPAKLAEQAADRAERLGDYLKRTDADSMMRSAEDFGRRQPWTVMLGGLTVGFVASRFLKASSSRRYESANQSAGRYGGDGAGQRAVVPPRRPVEADVMPVRPADADIVPGRPGEADVSLSGGVLPNSSPEVNRPGGAF
jgi:hypothetical protein